MYQGDHALVLITLAVSLIITLLQFYNKVSLVERRSNGFVVKIGANDFIYLPYENIISIREIRPSVCTSFFLVGLFTRGQLINGVEISITTDLPYCLFSNASVVENNDGNDCNNIDYIDNTEDDDTNTEYGLWNSPNFNKSNRIHEYNLKKTTLPSSSRCCNNWRPNLSLVFSPEVGPASFLIGNDDVVVGCRERLRTGEAFRMYGGESKRWQQPQNGMMGGQSPVVIGI